MAPGKMLRVDAQRRRQALLCAAASVFQQEGLEAPLEDVARTAGVGIATLYRRFPTRDALVEAVFQAKMSACADRIEAAAQQAACDPWVAFSEVVGDVCAMQVSDPAFARVMLRPMQGCPLFTDEHVRAMRACRQLVHRAREAGVVRPDICESDLYLIAVAVGALVSTPGPIPAGQAACRLVDLFLEAVKGPRCDERAASTRLRVEGSGDFSTPAARA